MGKLVDRVSKPSSSSNVQLPPSDFGALMSLEKINGNHYRSLKTPFKPAVARGVFGGHLLAQSLYVASKTVPRLYICNNMQAQFLNGNTDSVPFHYLIERIRDGSRYLVRSVRVFQYIPSHKRNGRPCGRSEAKATLVFTALVSFKKIEEPGQIVIVKDGEDEGVVKWSHRPAAPVLAIKPEECSSAPDIDIPKWIEWASDDSNQYMQIQHAIDVRKVPHTYAKQAEEFASRKMYHYYKSVTKLYNDPNLHLSAHIYASDRNSLFVASRIIGKADSIEQVTSLTHAIVFFPPSSLDNKSVAPADDGWSLMESWTGMSGDGRILYSGRLYDQQGCMIAEFLQDGMAIFSSKL